ncbi:MAG: EAL domain-containing protein [Clostridium sp.]
MKKKILLNLITIFIILFTYTGINIYLNDTINEFIISKKIDNINLENPTLLEVENKQLYKHAQKLSNHTSSKSFINGYISLASGETESSKSHLQTAINKIDVFTPHKIKLYSHKLLINILLDEDDYSNALIHINNVSKLFKETDYNEHYNLVWNILASIRQIPDRMPLLNKYIISIINNYNLSNEAKIFFYRKILATSVINGDYLKGIEYVIKILDLCNSEDLYYYKGKTLVDLSVISKNLNDSTDAIAILQNIDSTKILDPIKRADLEIYKCINLVQNQIILFDYEEALKSLTLIDSHLSNLPDNKRNEINIIKQLNLAIIYIQQNKIEEGREILSNIPSDFYSTYSYSYPNTYVDYLIALGELYIKEKNFEDARTIFEDIIKFKYRGVELVDYTYSIKQLIAINSILNDEIKLKDALYKQNAVIKFEKSLQLKMSYNYIDEEQTILEMESKHKQIFSLNIIYFILLIIIIITIVKLNILPMLINNSCRKRFRNYMAMDNFFLVYQPIINPKTNKLVGLEALIRLKDGDKIIPPNLFLPKLCSVGLVGELALWEIEKINACYDDIMKLQLNDKNIYVSINVSLQEIENRVFIENIIKECDELFTKGATLCLEITENIGLGEKQCIKEHISILVNAGFNIAIDDFGVDYSNISLLDYFDFHILKLDKYFIDNISTSVVVKSLMNVVNDLSTEMNISVVVEGVEEEWQCELIKQYSSDSLYIQGYYYSKPLSIEELKDFKLDDI